MILMLKNVYFWKKKFWRGNKILVISIFRCRCWHQCRSWWWDIDVAMAKKLPKKLRNMGKSKIMSMVRFIIWYFTKCNNFMEIVRMMKIRSSNRRCSIRKSDLRDFAKFTVKHLCQSLFYKIVGVRSATLLK